MKRISEKEIDAIQITQDDRDELEEMATIGLVDCVEDHGEYVRRVPCLLEQRLKSKTAQAQLEACEEEHAAKMREGMVEILCGYGDDVRIENCDACLSYDEANNRCKKAAPIQKIREGILKHLCDYGAYVCKETCYGCLDFDEGANRCKKIDPLLTFLDANGLVIWKEKELPIDPTNTRQCFTINGELHAFDTGYFAARQDMVKHIEDCKERLI